MEPTAAEKPFAALFDVISIGIRNGVFRDRLFRALCTRATAAKHIRISTAPAKKRGRPLGMMKFTCQYQETRATQRKSGMDAGQGLTLRKSCFATGNHSARRSCTICFLELEIVWRVQIRKDNLDNMRHFRSAFIAVCLLLATAPGFAQGGKKSPSELVVAAAADLSTALPEIGNGYQKKTGVKLKFSFGASGALTQQIQNGAPFDLFFSADMDYPRQLIAAGDADSATLYQYAVGKLVLWVPADSPLDVEHQGMNVLLDPSVKKIAIANPQHAPYGRAAMAALQHSGLYDRVADRLVLGENVSQAAQFAESGNAQAGFVALAHAVAPGRLGKGKYWEVPAEFYPTLAQGVVVLSRSPHKKEAADFLNYIKTKEAADLFRKYGFILP
jgi:molybdate transport system substrate-binding protein